MKKAIRRFKKCVRLIRTAMKILFVRHGQRLILIGSPLHGNIGDHAISIAERAFFKECMPGMVLVEIAGADFRYFSKWLPGQIRTEDVILLTGGGFMGNLWLIEEEMIRKVILCFPKNPVIILPQTVYYSNDEEGQMQLEISRQIYGTHKRLHIFLREQQSCEFVRENFPGLHGVECVPDMVLYLNLTASAVERRGILTCFREDKERISDRAELEKMISVLRTKYGKVSATTTVLDRDILFDAREKVFYDKIREFQRSRLVVTDRLHGMLFAAITGTPCIALDNLSGKVKGVYEWIADLEYVQFAQTVDEVLHYADLLIQMGCCQYDSGRLRGCLYKIAERVREYGCSK